MNKTTYLITISLFIISTLASCKKSDTPAAVVLPINDNSLPSGAAIRTQLTNKSSSSLEFALDLTVFRDSKNLEDQLKPENFSIDTLIQSATRYYFDRQNVNLVSGSSNTPYSALMLMDQSGSISSTDPKDYRIDAAKAFCNNLGQGDNVMLWSFEGINLKQYGSGFTTNGSSLIADIESLKGNLGGSTPLYKSQYAVTNFTATNAPSANKAVMTFTDGEDTDGSITAAQVISNAVAKNVRLYNVGLGNAQILSLSNQAEATGGAFMFAQDARQLISMFGNLGKLLNKTAQYYHTTWKVTKSSGNFSSGTLLCTARIKLPYNNSVVTIPFTLSY